MFTYFCQVELVRKPKGPIAFGKFLREVRKKNGGGDKRRKVRKIMSLRFGGGGEF